MGTASERDRADVKESVSRRKDDDVELVILPVGTPYKIFVSIALGI